MHVLEHYTLKYSAISSREPFGSSVVVENGCFGKLTGKHGDTLKDRDKEGGGFRDVVIERGKFKSKLRWGVGRGGS